MEITLLKDLLLDKEGKILFPSEEKKKKRRLTEKKVFAKNELKANPLAKKEDNRGIFFVLEICRQW